MGPFLTYTVLRLALFGAALGVFWLLGARGLLLLVFAAFSSLAASYVLLRGPREELSRALAERADPARRSSPDRPRSRFSRRLDEDTAAEDTAAEDTAAEDTAAEDTAAEDRVAGTAEDPDSR